MDCNTLLSGTGYLLLIMAQEECKRHVWAIGNQATVEACHEVYEQFMKARQLCSAQFVQQVAAGAVQKEQKGDEK